MNYFCETCLGDVKRKSKYSHLKSKSHKEYGKYKHLILSLRNVDIKDADEILYLNMIDHYKKINHYLIKSQCKLVFNDNQDCNYLITGMINITTNISRSNYFRIATDSLKTEEYDSN